MSIYFIEVISLCRSVIMILFDTSSLGKMTDDWRYLGYYVTISCISLFYILNIINNFDGLEYYCQVFGFEILLTGREQAI